MNVEKKIADLAQIEHGFKHIFAAGDELLADTSIDHLQVAKSLVTDPRYQGRMLATYLLGQLSPGSKPALQVLKTIIVKDENWRVQEMLAKAFDFYCSRIGYEAALPEINSWLDADDPNLNRAVIEGLRIWTSRPYFDEHIMEAINLISRHKASDSEYLRKSVGNALRDIRKKHTGLIDQALTSWDLSDTRVAFTHKILCR